MMPKLERMAIRVQGIVQGVGFRPFIFNLAEECGLSGWVTNDSAGVLMEVEGPGGQIATFLEVLPFRIPPLARIDRMEHWSIPVKGDQTFTIHETDRSERVRTLISPDMATCDDCLQELFDSNNRRYQYPFINCTNCGPRFTIIEEMPYDRPFTTMREFAMCSLCDEEYHNPRQRRFHAQPNACPTCGPHVWLTDATGRIFAQGDPEPGKDSPEQPDWAMPIYASRDLIRRGKIFGVKGIGGYHLVCDAQNAEAVDLLRKRKHRPDRPLAVMVPDLETARRYCDLTPDEEKVLQSQARPITLVSWKARGADGIAYNVAPGQSRLGVMLPYSPLHHLLFTEDLPVLVMTSGNLSGEPVIFDDAEAIARLGRVVDYFLMHDRRIVRPCDDSVQRVDRGPTMIRRSRGYAPMPLKLDQVGEVPILAAGGELKNTFALARNGQVFMSQHIGDLKTRNSLHHYRRMIGELTHVLEMEPAVVAYDLHPGYLSTQYVLQTFNHSRLIGVQHHHAHVVGCMAEYGLNEPVIGLAFDGTGYGTDGKIWGGEVLVARPGEFTRWAHLRYMPLPGGDQAVQEPWRVGAAYLEETFPGENRMEDLPLGFWVDPMRWHVLRQMLEKRVQTPETSSMGRLFDAVAAILGVRGYVTYEGQAAMELEEWAGNQLGSPYPFAVTGLEPPYIIDPLPLLDAMVRDVRAGMDRSRVAQRFHGTIVEIARQVAKQIRQTLGIQRVVLSGGVFQNRLLSMGLQAQLEADGFTVYPHRQVPANDGGLALGQVYVTSAMISGS